MSGLVVEFLDGDRFHGFVLVTLESPSVCESAEVVGYEYQFRYCYQEKRSTHAALTQNPSSAESFTGAATLTVQAMRAKLPGHAIQGFKSVYQSIGATQCLCPFALA